MKKGVYLTVFLVIVLCLSFISANTVHVRTLPNHKVSIFLLSPGSVYSLIDSKHVTADSTGIVTMEYPGTSSELNINVKITKDGEQIMFEKFTEIPTSADVYLQVKPNNISENYKEDDDAAKAMAEAAEAAAANETTEEEVIEEETGNESIIGKGLTGFTTLKDKMISLKDNINMTYVLYFVLGVVVISGVVVLIIKKPFQGNKLLVLSRKDSDPIPNMTSLDEKKLESAEKKIQEAQEDIERIKNKKKDLTEAEKQFEEAKKRLAELKGE